MQLNDSKRIFGLDLMRAIAIVLVVFSHITWVIPNAQGIIPDLMSIAGVIGVEIFFVLSGFLIGRIIYKLYTSEEFKWSNIFYFWIRRWFRTLPNYFLALVLNIGIVLCIGFQLPDNLWKYLFFIQNLSSEMPSFFIESWSLSIEEFAYIIGPLALYLITFFRLKQTKSRLFLWATLFILICFIITKLLYSMNDDVKTMTHWNSNLKAVVIYRIDAIYYGVLAAYVSLIHMKFWNHYRVLFFSIGIFGFFILNVGIPMNYIFIETYTHFWNIWYLPINSIFIMFTLPLLSHLKTAPKLILKPITYLSIISYAMYVLHYSIILQLLKYYLPTDTLAKFDIMIYILVYLSITFLCSYIVYKFYEKPLTDLRDSRYFKRKFN